MSKESEKPSQEFVINQLNNLSMEQRRFLFGFINLNQSDLVIDWDLDQTLEITEDSVKAIVDAERGTNYFNRKIDGWNSIARWLTEDKILSKEQANAYEYSLWITNEVLMMGPPNNALRRLSYIADQRGIDQYVTTVRVPGLRQTTYKWLDAYFPWIPKGNINVKIGMFPTGFEYKIATVIKMYEDNPGLIHVDDDLKVLRALSEAAPELGVIGILCPSDDVSDIKYADNRVFLERDVLGSLVYYGVSNETMSSANK